jgi:hypothetical protein
MEYGHECAFEKAHCTYRFASGPICGLTAMPCVGSGGDSRVAGA